MRVCIVYPNTYYIGMSNLGFQTVYRLFNSIEECVCERAFLPDKADMDEYASGNVKLASLESGSPLSEFDIVAFSVSFEEDFLNLPKLLEFSGIPVLSKDRGSAYPMIMAGGCGVSLNPEPVADVMDFFFIGEAEPWVTEFVNVFSLSLHEEREKILEKISGLPGVYVPSFYEVRYEGDRIDEVLPVAKTNAPFPVKRVRVGDIDGEAVPISGIVTPDTEFSDTVLIEVERGCPRGCRFCTAGYIYLPPRFRDSGRVKEAVSSGLDLCGKVGLVGAAVSEYPGLKDLLKLSIEKGGKATVSSLRIDEMEPEMLELLKESGYRTITLAPEAGSDRLRKVINKDFSDKRIYEAVQYIYEAGFKRVKLYYMVGLPTETDPDVEAIADMVIRIRDMLKGGAVILSINPFVPKPVTPFGWHAFEKIETIEKRYGIINSRLKKEGGVTIKTLPAGEAFFQAYLARGDRRTVDTVLLASKIGWKRAIKKIRDVVESSVYRERDKQEILPWDIIDQGLKKEYLWKEYERALNGKTTPPCDVEHCTRCGIC